MVQMPNCYLNHITDINSTFSFIEGEYSFKYIFMINMTKPFIYRIFGIEINFE